MRISNNNREPHEQTRTKDIGKLVWFVVIFLFFNIQLPAEEADHLAAFSDPANLWKNNVERIIEEAYRQCFRTRIIGDRVMNIRLPFAMNNERDMLLESKIPVIGDGKGSPEMLWELIEKILDSDEFKEYIYALSSGREKVFIFDMVELKWTATTDIFIISRMKSRNYKILPHRPYVLTSGRGALESDVYNYLYCIGLVGIDCSGFVWHVLSYLAKEGGVDLGKELTPVIGAPRGSAPSLYVGTAFFNSRSSQITAIEDKIENLRPADILLFRDIGGTVSHSAVIQSIDTTKGIIRYLQCTNTSLPHERGVHESFIYFNPANTSVSLKDSSLHWSKRRFPAFAGEDEPFADDGERFRNKTGGGGRVVRLRPLIPIIEKLNE
ncbi:MAG: peptidoglycan endopeptidase [Treponema sp.]|nr:peptidoglycan endopeptidase [Treponema sp.]